MSEPALALELKASPDRPVFDRNIKYQVAVQHPDYPNDKIFRMNFPTDEQWCQRMRRQSRILRIVTGGAWQSEPKGHIEASEDLLRKIIDEDCPPYDSEDADFIITRLESCTPLSVEKEGGQYRIKMELPWSAPGEQLIVEHVLRVPTQKQLVQLDKASSTSVQRSRFIETRQFLEPFGDLWSKLLVSVSGYAEPPDVPIVQKHIALTELITTMKDEVREGPAPEA